jgi:lipopolysaccharide/colanic/teichoic acid biosynthesis glycosyltransferase
MTNAVVKRCYDLLWAALGLVVLSPVLLLIALRIRLAGDGPVFFQQQRVGQGWRLFWLWFRCRRNWLWLKNNGFLDLLDSNLL